MSKPKEAKLKTSLMEHMSPQETQNLANICKCSSNHNNTNNKIKNNDEKLSINTQLRWRNAANNDTPKKKRKTQPKQTRFNRNQQTNKIHSYMKVNPDNLEQTDEQEESLYGLPHTTKSSDVIRLWYTNPCGIGVNPTHLKSDDSFSFLRSKSKCDVFGLAETNVHWRKLYGHASLYSRVKKRWRYFKIATSHNSHANLGVTQRGGTCTVAVGQAAYRVYQTGQDESGLGRWSWLEFRGRDEWCTRVYTAYRPGSKPPNEEGTTVYHQHARYLRQQKINQDPRQFFDECIITELANQINRCNVVLMIDANQDVRTGHFNQEMNDLGLINIISNTVQQPLPATHHRGSKPISAIYASSMIQATRAGILPKGQGVHGDHRNMYVDLTASSTLGTYMYQIVSPPMKTLQLKDSRTVKRFVKQIRKHIKHNNLSLIGLELMHTSGYPATANVIKLMETFDSQLGRAIDSAKSKCRTIKTGAIPFSDTFAKLREEYRLWLLVRKKLLGQKVSNTTIRRLAKRREIQNPMAVPLKEATCMMYEASKQYQSFAKQHARDGRDTFYEALAAANAMHSNTSKSKILERIMRDEKLREQTILNRKYFPKRNAPSQKVDRIQFQKGTATVEVSKPKQVLQACQDDTKAKYNETSSTPLMDPDTQRRWGNFAETTFSRNFQAHGATLPRNTPTWMEAMLKRTQHDYTIPRLPITMNSTEIKSAWSKVKEHKATSPSGRYNGVYKVMSMHKDLLQMLTYSMNIPFVTGQPYERWKHMIDIMAFKKPNNIHVSNIRSIIISEADWNTAGKIHIARRMMQNAEDCNLLPDEHIGGRKGRKATDGVLTKRLFLDNARLLRRPVAIISTDAANCYDRMTHTYIALMCIKWGLAAQVMIALLKPLQLAKHHTRTAYGDSTTYFEGRNLQGAGQGNTGAAPYWTSVSTPMIEEMKAQLLHAKMISPISGIVVLLALLAFVDDTELFIMHASDKDEEVIKKAQRALMLWRALLNVTGGIMRSKKCAWTLMSFESDRTKPLKSMQSVPGNLTLPDEDGVIRSIERYDSDHPREYLGVYQTTSGSETPQLEKMQKAVDKWNILMESSRLPPVLNLQVTLSKIHRTLSYPLPTLSIPEHDLQLLSDTLYWKTLPKCGIVRTFPIYARTLPYTYQGLNLPDLYLEQEISKVKELLNLGSVDSITSKQLYLGLETLQLHVGVRDIILNYDFNKFQSITPSSWLKSIWQFLSSQEYTIKGWPHQLQNPRDNDQCLMETIVNSNELSHTELDRINQCRIYLQVWSLSDIVDGNGTRITDKAFAGYRDSSRTSTLTWNDRKRPHYVCWLEWRKYLTKTFTTNDRTLRRPLGPWIRPSHQKWEWFYSANEGYLYRKLQGHVRQYRPARHSRSSARSGTLWFEIYSILKDDEIELNRSIPATVSESASGYKYVKTDGWSYKRVHNPQSPLNTRGTLLQMLRNQALPTWIGTYGNLNEWTYDETSDFLTKKLRLVSDGSYDEGKGAACTIIEAIDGSSRMIFSTNVPANIHPIYHNNDAYRSELFGIYSGFRVLSILEKIFMKQTSIQISCDNDTALMVSEEYTYINSGVKHFDVVKAIVHYRSKILSKLSYQTVIGHAKDKNIGRPLTRTEELNDLCDEFAKIARESYPQLGPVQLEGEGLSLWLHERKIYTAIEKQIRREYFDKKAKSVMSQKYDWNDEQFNLIDWQAYERATRLMHSSTLIKIAKCVTQTLPVGQTMETRKQWNQSYCPRCLHPVETVDHLYVCPHKESREIIGESIMALDEWLESASTEPILRSQLITIISQYVSGTPIQNTNDLLPPLQRQCLIGWKHFFQGRIHSTFAEYMQQYYQSINSKKRGKKWTATLIQKLWTVLFQKQWDHRNKCVHGREKTIKSTRENQNLQQTIRSLYTTEQQNRFPLLSRDRYLMDTPLTEIQRKPTAQKRAWIADMRLAITERDEANAIEAAAQSNLMHRFLESSPHLSDPLISRSKAPKRIHRKRRVSTKPRRRCQRAYEQSIPRKQSISSPRRSCRFHQKPRKILPSQKRSEPIAASPRANAPPQRHAKRRVTTKPRRPFLRAYELTLL